MLDLMTAKCVWMQKQTNKNHHFTTAVLDFGYKVFAEMLHLDFAKYDIKVKHLNSHVHRTSFDTFNGSFRCSFANLSRVSMILSVLFGVFSLAILPNEQYLLSFLLICVVTDLFNMLSETFTVWDIAPAFSFLCVCLSEDYTFWTWGRFTGTSTSGKTSNHLYVPT